MHVLGKDIFHLFLTSLVPKWLYEGTSAFYKDATEPTVGGESLKRFSTSPVVPSLLKARFSTDIPLVALPYHVQNTSLCGENGLLKGGVFETPAICPLSDPRFAVVACVLRLGHH